ncbi:NF2L2 factor, partial [Mionectes macconnelli]|nr:NF2L2 factor [Mionectes macconnelli]
IPLGRSRRRIPALALPLAPEAIVSLPAEELRAALCRARASGAQRALCRDIRRRGRNKAAAQRCRRRRLEAVARLGAELARLRAELARLGAERERLVRALGALRGQLDRVAGEVLG